MKFSIRTLPTIAALLAAMGLFGCTPRPAQRATDAEAHEHAHDHDGQAHDDHADHGEVGPHGGHLIELGHKHEYHGELVRGPGDANFTIHVLDHDLKSVSGAVEAASIVVTRGGTTTNLALEPTDAPGVMRLADGALGELFESSDEVSGKLRVTIDGVPHSGEWQHHPHD